MKLYIAENNTSYLDDNVVINAEANVDGLLNEIDYEKELKSIDEEIKREVIEAIRGDDE